MTLSARAHRKARLTSVLVAMSAAGAACLAGTTAVPTAAAADDCVTAYPKADLTRDQDVNGLTVTAGTVPEAFTGKIAGVLTDGIAPGVDMILAELDSTALRKNGIWAGMSGSPVYADADHTQLVGAVSYTLNEGATTLAGITPAADMLALTPGEAAPLVKLSPAVTRRLVADGVATSAEAASGMRQLPTPIGISGLTSSRFKQMAGWLDDHGPVARAVGGAAAADAATVADIVPGGNVAASFGYGFVTAAATGTVTAVCGSDVIAFGHPFAYTGDATYSLHPADAVAIVPGGTLGGFKLANLGDPVGAITGDHLAGINGTLGKELPEYDVTSTATYGAKTVTGTTHVTVPDMVADAGLANAFAVSDRALDKQSKGTADASWTITGLRRNGTPFTLTRDDVYTDSADVASAPVSQLAMALYSLLENETEKVTITSVSTTTALRDDATQYRIGRVFWRSGTAWRRATESRPVIATVGRASRIKVELYSRTAPSKFVTYSVTPARASAGRVGRFVVQGGYSGMDDFEFFDSEEQFYEEYGDEMDTPQTIPDVLRELAQQQKNDVVSGKLTLRGTTSKRQLSDLDQVVSGFSMVPVLVRR
jgi:hypothetical protein